MAIINHNSISGVTTVSVGSSIVVGDTFVITSNGLENITQISATGVITATSFSGALTGNVTGSATALSGTPDVTVGTLNATDAIISGDLTVQGTTTTLDTVVTEVDKLEVDANNTTVGVAITQSGTGDILRLYDGASQVVTVADGGSVGIGTDNPPGQLTLYQTNNDVYASTTRNYEFLSIQNKSTTSGSRVGFDLQVEGVGNASVATISAIDAGNGYTDLAIGLRNSSVYQEKLRITSNGRIGIGTDNPSNPLHISTSSITPLLVESTGADSYIRFQNSGGSSGYVGYLNAQEMVFWVNGSERLRVGSSGNVGIKTTTPNNTLTVGDTVQPSYAPSTAGNYIEIARTSGADAGLLINKNTGQWLIGIDNSDGANAPLRFEYGAAGSAHPGFGAGTLGMIMKHDGKIGIGTDNPVTKLQVVGTSRFDLGSITTEGPFYINGNKAVSNGAIVHVRNDGVDGTHDVFGGIKFSSSPGYDFVLGKNSRYGTGYFQIRNQADTPLLTISGTGNVGIGTDNPAAALDVRGSAFLSPLTLTSGGDGSWIKSAYGAISNSVVSSLNNLLIGQNMRGYLNSDGGSANNNYYNIVTYPSGTVGYAGLEFCYGGIAKFFTGTPATTADATFTPTERLRIGPSGQIGLSGENYGSSGQVLTSQGSGSAPQWATPSSAGVIQVKSTTKTNATSFTSSSSSFSSDVITVSITPTSSSNKILIIAHIHLSASATTRVAAKLTVGGSEIAAAKGDAAGSSTRSTITDTAGFSGNCIFPSSMTFLHSPGTTSALTYGIQISAEGNNTVYLNQPQSGNTTLDIYRPISTITVMEVTP